MDARAKVDKRKQELIHAALGGRIQAARKRAKLSQQDVAYRLSVNLMAVSRWERGVSLPHPEHVEALASLLGMSSARLAADVAQSSIAARAERAAKRSAA